MFSRRQLVSFEPRQEAVFCMVGFILIDLGEMGKEGKGTLWAGTGRHMAGRVGVGMRAQGARVSEACY